jgi:isocitrate lyase
LIYRYKVNSVHFVTPNEDNLHQTNGMKAQGIFSSASQEIGEIIVADVAIEQVKQFVGADRSELVALIAKKS